MDFNAIIKRAIGIITKPKEEWGKIKQEEMTVVDIYMKYAIVMAAIPAVAGFLGYSLIGVSFGIGTIRIPIFRSLIWAIFQYVFSLAAAYLFAFIIDTLAPSFAASKNMVQSLKIVVYSYTASWIAGVFFLIPQLAVLSWILSLYTFYLLFTGMRSLKEAPEDKFMGYFIVTIVAAIIIFFFVGWIVATIAFGSARGFMF